MKAKNFRNVFVKTLKIAALFFMYSCLIIVSAQAVAPSLVEQILSTPWDRIFIDIGALAALINIVVSSARSFKPEIFKGPVSYFVAISAGVVLGLVGDLSGLIQAGDFSSFPKPFAGISYGLVAGLSAVGLHQGKAQTGEQLANSAAKKLRR